MARRHNAVEGVLLVLDVGGGHVGRRKDEDERLGVVEGRLDGRAPVRAAVDAIAVDPRLDAQRRQCARQAADEGLVDPGIA